MAVEDNRPSYWKYWDRPAYFVEVEDMNFLDFASKINEGYFANPDYKCWNMDH